MNKQQPAYDITITQVGKSSQHEVRLTVGDELIFLDQTTLAKEKDRKRLVNQIIEKFPAISETGIHQQILQHLNREHVGNGGSDAGAEEIELDQVIRPDRFIFDHANGISIPVAVQLPDEGLAWRWKYYVQHRDGEREVIPLRSPLIVGESKLIISPVPQLHIVDDPTLLWSKGSRSAWLNNSPPPDPVELFAKIVELLNAYVDFPHGGETDKQAEDWACTVSLFVLLTYAYPIFPAVPYLWLTGPTGSGKSRVLECVRQLAFRPVNSSSMTASAVFRTLDETGGVLLLDEAEGLHRGNTYSPSELYQILLAGNARGGRVTRVEGDTIRRPKSYSVYSPKCLASIRTFTGPLLARCIVVRMFRSKSQKCERSVERDADSWRGTRDDLHRLALQYGPEWLEVSKGSSTAKEFAARAYQLWHPLLTLAAWLESHGLEGIRERVANHAQRVQETFLEEQFPAMDEIVLQVLASAVEDDSQPKVRCKDLLVNCKRREPQIFRHISERRISSILQHYQIKTHKGHRNVFIDSDVKRRLELVENMYGIELFGFDEV